MAEDWTQERLEQVGHEWQKRLALQDWAIGYHLVNAYQLDGDYAECDRPTEFKRIATVSVGDPMHHTDAMKRMPDSDPEYSVVHELIHLQLFPLRDVLSRLEQAGGAMVKPLTKMAYEEHRSAEERAIHDLALAFIALKRGGGTSAVQEQSPVTEVLLGPEAPPAG